MSLRIIADYNRTKDYDEYTVVDEITGDVLLITPFFSVARNYVQVCNDEQRVKFMWRNIAEGYVQPHGRIV